MLTTWLSFKCLLICLNLLLQRRDPLTLVQRYKSSSVIPVYLLYFILRSSFDLNGALAISTFNDWGEFQQVKFFQTQEIYASVDGSLLVKPMDDVEFHAISDLIVKFVNVSDTNYVRKIPDVADKTTILSFARMAASAYVRDPTAENWIDIGGNWNRSKGIGWDSDGIRGHIFVEPMRAAAVIALKGTTTLISSEDSDTYERDRINDNLLFSCCCGRSNVLQDPVCDCYESTYTCSQSCLENELASEDKYYRSALAIYHYVLSLYPEASIWVTGHSLAASLGSLIAQSTGRAAVTFCAPGEKLAASRLHLPSKFHPNSGDYIWHFGNTADPIFMGTCNGPLSPCYLAGYSMETQCHSGRECIYDTVHDKDYSMSLIYHQIESFIDIIEEYDSVAPCFESVNCLDCYLWDYE
ncbi:Alpha/Beta hydrolase protein [Lipomyces arxii]|uniref:Alpha/Beta hydrolase protein n=1 Tax=Lipomyces arxii TaxID=56418 RepID=UPI0034CECC74